MNQITPVGREALITFGKLKQKLYTDIYNNNTRISYPMGVILLAMGDIKACFRFAWSHADLTGAFGFFAKDLYNLAMAMVFGLTSVSSWEPFCWIIESLSEVLANRSELFKKHKNFSTW